MAQRHLAAMRGSAPRSGSRSNPPSPQEESHRTTGTVRRRRVALDYTNQEYLELEKLAREAAKLSVADFVRTSVRFYRWYLQNKAEGSQLMIERNGKAAAIDVLL
jgi:hypothetical protein